MNPLQLIPTRIRTSLYVAFGTVGFALGGLQFIGVDDLWGFSIIKALALVGYLSAPFAVTAVSNVVVGADDSGPGMGAGVDPDQPTDVE
jgi:hypothetical protein